MLLTYLHLLDRWQYIKNLDNYPLNVFGSKTIFFLKIFFLCGSFLKSLLGLLCITSALCFGFFGPVACGILVRLPGIEPAPSVLESKVLTTGPPGNFLKLFLYYSLGRCPK